MIAATSSSTTAHIESRSSALLSAAAFAGCVAASAGLSLGGTGVQLGVLGLLCALIAWLLTVPQRPVRALYLIAVFVFVQDVIVMALSQFAHGRLFEVVGYVVLFGKEAALAGALAGCLIVRARPRAGPDAHDLLAVAFTGWVTLHLALPSAFPGSVGAGFEARATSARSLLVPVLLYGAGRFSYLSRGDFERVVRLVMTLALAALLVGLTLIMIPEGGWANLGLRELLLLKLGPKTVDLILEPSRHIPYGMYFSDLSPQLIPWPGIRRMSSTIMDPIASGLMFSGLLVLATSYSAGRGPTLGVLAFAIGTLMSLTKGGFAVAATGLLYVKSRSPKLAAAVAVTGALLGTILYVGVLPRTAGVTGTAIRPLAAAAGFGQALAYPLGRGLGASGYLTVARTGEDILAEQEGLTPFAVETFVGTAGIQLGLVGIVLYFGFMLGLSNALYRISRTLRGQNLLLGRSALALGGIVWGLLAVSALSSSGFGFVGVGVMFLLSGLALNPSLRSAVAPSHQDAREQL